MPPQLRAKRDALAAELEKLRPASIAPEAAEAVLAVPDLQAAPTPDDVLASLGSLTL
jgi:hypothetical protein